MAIAHLTDDNFKQEVLSSDIPVLVDFFADWCGPCKSIAPVIEELSAEYDGRLKVCKINVDQGQATASAYNVMSIPTLIIFKQGNIAEQLVGSVSKGQLQQKIDRVLAV